LHDKSGTFHMNTAKTVIQKTINTLPAESQQPFRFRNHYECPNDATKWNDEWTCTYNDRCPVCDREIEPYFSEDVLN